MFSGLFDGERHLHRAPVLRAEPSHAIVTCRASTEVLPRVSAAA